MGFVCQGGSTPCNTADIVGVWSSGGVCRWSSFLRRVWDGNSLPLVVVVCGVVGCGRG